MQTGDTIYYADILNKEFFQGVIYSIGRNTIEIRQSELEGRRVACANLPMITMSRETYAKLSYPTAKAREIVKDNVRYFSLCRPTVEQVAGLYAK